MKTHRLVKMENFANHNNDGDGGGFNYKEVKLTNVRNIS